MQAESFAVSMPLPHPPLDEERFLLGYLPMVRTLARKMHRRLPQNVDVNDLYSAGLIGLMEASTKFNPAKEVHFASYASFRIRGAMLDSLRNSDWAPRDLRRKGRAVQAAIQALTVRLGRSPSEEEVAVELHITLDGYQRLLEDLNGLEIGVLYRDRNDVSGAEEVEYVPGPPDIDPFFRCLRGELTDRLTQAIESLPERERLVTTLFYYEEMTAREIGLVLGLETIKVFRIRTSAILHLRATLSDLLPHRPFARHAAFTSLKLLARNTPVDRKPVA